MEAPLRLRDSHRQWIRALAGEMRELLGELHQHGVSDELTADLRQRIEQLEQAVGVSPAERGDVVGAALSRLWVVSCELRAKSVQGYGELAAHERAFFDQQSAEFERSVHNLREAVSGAQASPTAEPSSSFRSNHDPTQPKENSDDSEDS